VLDDADRFWDDFPVGFDLYLLSMPWDNYPEFYWTTDKELIMPFIIDGHNLIPKVPGLNLADLEDELQLVEVLQEFCRINRKQVEVYFDNAPPGGMEVRVFGSVTARFIRQGMTADQAIKNRLQRLGGEARNWTVVSSDREVQASARKARAKIIPAEVFAQQLIPNSGRFEPESNATSEALSPDEIQDWMDLFGVDKEDDNGEISSSK
jgi:predicted RNA-binding protein with PIN domain